jgi:hypothetical protein
MVAAMRTSPRKPARHSQPPAGLLRAFRCYPPALEQPGIIDLYHPFFTAAGNEWWSQYILNRPIKVDGANNLLVQYVAGITPGLSDSLVIDPVDMGWKSFSFKNIRYRNHDIDIEFSREKGVIIRVDGVVIAQRAALQKVSVVLAK